MIHASIETFLAAEGGALAKGPVAITLVEDLVAVPETLRHNIDRGFATLIVLAPDALVLPDDLAARVHRIRFDMRSPGALTRAVNPLIAAAPPGTWMHYGYNAEFLFHPFGESRNVRELLTFHTEERRDAMLTYVVDLYAADLAAHPDAVDLDRPMFDRTGYYALARVAPDGHHRERQMNCFGGLRWRFEEHVPAARRRIDRISLFRARPGLQLADDHTFNDPEYNTYSCPWHHNLTAAVASFRAAKALMSNPGSRAAISQFTWANSQVFEWRSQQLMDLGLMEPGQWF
ncbi:hypothetical protein ACEYYB_02695 [Paracoccus sp. p4-l81]|uniref:hypothetical protein n=1 Tax=unclassified Paracoccus (in: a-proteobacteria) TaxID=2688777 RepID=UPI0035B957BE